MTLKLSSLSRGYGTLDGTVLIESCTASEVGQETQAEWQGNKYLKLPEISVKKIVPQSSRRARDKYVPSSADHPDLPQLLAAHNGIDVPKTFSTRSGALILFSDDAYPKKRKVKRERFIVPPDFDHLIEADQLDKIPLNEFKKILLDLEETMKNNHFLANLSNSSVDENFIDVRPGFSPCRYMASMATFWDPETLERLLSEQKLHSATLRKYLAQGHKFSRLEKDVRGGLFNRRPRTYSYLSLPEIELSSYSKGDLESTKVASNHNLSEIHPLKRVKKDGEPSLEGNSTKQQAVRPRVFQMSLPSILGDSESVALESDTLNDLSETFAPYRKRALSSTESSDAPSESESFIALKTRMGQLCNGAKGKPRLPKLDEGAFPHQVGLMNVILLGGPDGKSCVKSVRWEHQPTGSEHKFQHPTNENGPTGKAEQADHNASRLPSIAPRGKSHVQPLSHSAKSEISSDSRRLSLCEFPALNLASRVEDVEGQRKGKAGQIKLPPIFMRQAKCDKSSEGDDRTSDSLGLDVEGHGIDLGEIHIDVNRKPKRNDERFFAMNIGNDVYYANSSEDESSDCDGEWAGKNFRMEDRGNAELSRKEILAKHSGLLSRKGSEPESDPQNRNTAVAQYSSARNSQVATAEDDNLSSESLIPSQNPQQDDVTVAESQTEGIKADNSVVEQAAQSINDITELPPISPAIYSHDTTSEGGDSEVKEARISPGSETLLRESEETEDNQQSERDMRDMLTGSPGGPAQEPPRESNRGRNAIDALRKISDTSVASKEELPAEPDSSSSMTSARKVASQTNSNLPEQSLSQSPNTQSEKRERVTDPMSENKSLDTLGKEPPSGEERSLSQADFESALDAIVQEVQEIAEPIKGSRAKEKTEKGKKRPKKQGRKKVKAASTPLFQVRRAEEDKPPAGLEAEPSVQIINDQQPKPPAVKRTKDIPHKLKQNREKRRRKKQTKVSLLDDFRNIMTESQDNKEIKNYEDDAIPGKASKPDGELVSDVLVASEKPHKQTETVRNIESNVSGIRLPSITDHKEKVTAPLPTELEPDSDLHSFGMSDDSGKEDGQLGVKTSTVSDAKSQRRKLAAEKRRLEVERRRLEKQHEKERLAEEAAREEKLKQEAEEEKQRRIEEYKRRKEEEEMDMKRREEEEAEARRRMESRKERERRQKEEERKKMEQMLADLRLEEEMRKERARISTEVEEEMKRKEGEMLAKLAENERQLYLERQRLAAEERNRLEEEKKREEEERLELERLKEIEEQRALEKIQEQLRQRHQYFEQLKSDNIALGFELKLTRAFTYSYFRALPGLSFQSALAVNNNSYVPDLPPIYETQVEDEQL